MLSLRANSAGLQKRNERMLHRRQAAREVGIRALVQPALHQVVRDAPRDTRRYVTGWIQAGNGAGVSTYPLLPIRTSRFAEQFEERLKDQAQKLGYLVGNAERRVKRMRGILFNWYEKWGRKDASARKFRAEVRKAEAAYQKLEQSYRRAKEEYAAYVKSRGEAVVIFGGKGRTLKITTRPKVYGGFGRVYSDADKTVMVLHNKEAHASIVESRSRSGGFLGGMKRMAKLGLAVVRGKYGRELLASGKAA